MQIGIDYELEPFIHTNLWVLVMVQIMWWGSAFCYYWIYVGKYPIFEQWRSRASEDEVWPWESESKENWRKMLWRSVILTLFNSLIVANSFTFVSEYFKIYAP